MKVLKIILIISIIVLAVVFGIMVFYSQQNTELGNSANLISKTNNPILKQENSNQSTPPANTNANKNQNSPIEVVNSNQNSNVNSELPPAAIDWQGLRLKKIPEKAVKISPQKDTLPPILHSNEWAKPIPVPGDVNSAGGEDSPFITPDGNTLYYFFTPDVSLPAEKQLNDGVTGIWKASKVNGEWRNPEKVVLNQPGEVSHDGCEFIQGDIMWFCSARKGFTGINFFTALYANNQWDQITYVGDELMKDYKIGEMTLTPDGNTMYFHSDRAGGKGSYDIWSTAKKSGTWQEPLNITSVNTEEMEGWPFVTPDGNELWFLRFYQGTPAIYRSKKSGGNWSSPEMIISQFAGEPSLDSAGNLYFVHHYYNDNKMLEADIYVAYKKK